MLFEIAIGDAYGAGFEFSSSEKIAEKNKGNRYETHDLGQIPAGHYTDDTQMSVAIAEVLLSGQSLNPLSFASAFVNAFKRDPKAGYAKGFDQLLRECANGCELLERIRPASTRNGAAMRAVPIGLLPTMEDVLAIAEVSAAVTHNTSEGIASAQIVALMAHGFIHRKVAVSDIVDFALGVVSTLPVSRVWQDNVRCDAIETISAVVTLLPRYRSLQSLLLASVDLGGDTDSVASIALGLASLSGEYINDIHPALVDGLESGTFGKTFLVDLDAKIELFLSGRSA